MKVEIRADGLHLSGYVNVPGRESRPVITSKGKVIEVIEQRAFQRAIEKADNIEMLLDHNYDRVLASTKENTLTVYEDEIGLRAEAVITDEETIRSARQGKLKGWSFGMKKIVDSIEERANNLPLRHVKDFILDHITLVLNKRPVYSSTSIELRADEEDVTEVEIRSSETELEIKDMLEEPKDTINYSKFENRILEIKVGI